MAQESQIINRQKNKMEYLNNNNSSLRHFEEMRIETVSELWKNELFTKIYNKPKSNNINIYMIVSVFFLLNMFAIGYISFTKKSGNMSMKGRNEILSNELLVSTK